MTFERVKQLESLLKQFNLISDKIQVLEEFKKKLDIAGSNFKVAMLDSENNLKSIIIQPPIDEKLFHSEVVQSIKYCIDRMIKKYSDNLVRLESHQNQNVAKQA